MREILLVEDNPADAYLTCDVLARGRQAGHVTVVANGAQALAFLRENRGNPSFPELVILDLNLPLKDGRAVLAEVKNNPSERKIPIVIFTTSQAASDIDRSYELGANCYVRKPGNLSDFVTAVEAVSQFWLGTAILPAKCCAPDHGETLKNSP